MVARSITPDEAEMSYYQQQQELDIELLKIHIELAGIFPLTFSYNLVN